MSVRKRAPSWRPGEPVSAGKLSEMSAATNAAAAVAGYGELRTGEDEPVWYQEGWRLGIITNAGPEGESDYADERYFVVETEIERGASHASPLVFENRTPWEVEGGDDPVPVIHTVTNLAEWLGHTHLLAVGTPVLFRAEFDRCSNPGEESVDPEPPRVRYVMSVGAASGGDSFWAVINGAVQDGTNDRWKYGFTEVQKTTAGYGGVWSPVTGGRSGTASGSNPAYNSIEDGNGPGGPWFNGVDHATVPAGFSLQPVPDFVVVRMFATRVSSELTEYWFSFENAVDGACEE